MFFSKLNLHLQLKGDITHVFLHIQQIINKRGAVVEHEFDETILDEFNSSFQDFNREKQPPKISRWPHFWKHNGMNFSKYCIHMMLFIWLIVISFSIIYNLLMNIKTVKLKLRNVRDRKLKKTREYIRILCAKDVTKMHMLMLAWK